MSKRIPCSQCGTPVLEMILESNSGICLNCYNPNIPLGFSEDEFKDSSETGLAEALEVAQNGGSFTVLDGENKLLAFLLRKGESDVRITKQTIAVRYSWLRKKPSTYFIHLAPGIVGRLMELGNIQKVSDQSLFKVGPGTAGSDRYIFDYPSKWISINCQEDLIEIKVRDQQKSLKEKLEYSDV